MLSSVNNSIFSCFNGHFNGHCFVHGGIAMLEKNKLAAQLSRVLCRCIRGCRHRNAGV